MLGNVQGDMIGKRRRFLGPVEGGYFRVPRELSLPRSLCDPAYTDSRPVHVISFEQMDITSVMSTEAYIRT